MSGSLVFALLAMGGLAVAAGFGLGWLLGAGRARARGFGGLRGADGEARAERARADEIGRHLAAAEARARLVEDELAEAQTGRAVAETKAAELRVRLEEQRELLDTTDVRLGDTFRALAA